MDLAFASIDHIVDCLEAKEPMASVDRSRVRNHLLCLFYPANLRDAL